MTFSIAPRSIYNICHLLYIMVGIFNHPLRLGIQTPVCTFDCISAKSHEFWPFGRTAFHKRGKHLHLYMHQETALRIYNLGVYLKITPLKFELLVQLEQILQIYPILANLYNLSLRNRGGRFSNILVIPKTTPVKPVVSDNSYLVCSMGIKYDSSSFRNSVGPGK